MSVLLSKAAPATSSFCGATQVDIYSFGVLLWELVTATPPMRGRLRPIKVPPLPAADVLMAPLHYA